MLIGTIVVCTASKPLFFNIDLVFPFWKDGQDSDDPKQSTADMTAFVSSCSLIKLTFRLFTFLISIISKI